MRQIKSLLSRHCTLGQLLLEAGMLGSYWIWKAAVRFSEAALPMPVSERCKSNLWVHCCTRKCQRASQSRAKNLEIQKVKCLLGALVTNKAIWPERQTTLSPTWQSKNPQFNLTCICLDYGRKAKHPEETFCRQWENKSIQKSLNIVVRFKPRNLPATCVQSICFFCSFVCLFDFLQITKQLTPLNFNFVEKKNISYSRSYFNISLYKWGWMVSAQISPKRS